MKSLNDVLTQALAVTPAPGDYVGEDGLLYCGKCHTARQFRMDRPPAAGRLLPRAC